MRRCEASCFTVDLREETDGSARSEIGSKRRAACLVKNTRRLLDARVVKLPRAYTPIVVMLSSLKPLFFHTLKHPFRLSRPTSEHTTPESKQSILGFHPSLCASPLQCLGHLFPHVHESALGGRGDLVPFKNEYGWIKRGFKLETPTVYVHRDAFGLPRELIDDVFTTDLVA